MKNNTRHPLARYLFTKIFFLSVIALTAGIQIAQAAADSEHSTIIANPTTVFADGTYTYVTVSLNDTADTPQSGKEVSLNFSRAALSDYYPVECLTGNYIYPAVTDVNGQACFWAWSYNVGQETITANDVTDGQTITSSTLGLPSTPSTIDFIIPPPRTPNLNVTNRYDDLQMVWYSDATTPYYNVFYGEASGFPGNATEVDLTSQRPYQTMTKRISGLTPGTTYSFYVVADNGAGSTVTTPTVTKTVFAAPAVNLNIPNNQPFFGVPSGLGMTSDGKLLVADFDNSQVHKFDPASPSNSISHIGRFGTENGELLNPSGVAVNSFGDIYVTDSTHNTVEKFDSSGNYISTINTFNSGNVFNSPNGIAIDASNSLYVTDNNNRVIQFNSEDAYVTEFGASDGLNNPIGVAVDSSGNVYVADRSNGRIMKFDPATEPGPSLFVLDPTFTSPALNWPTGIAVSGSTLYVASTDDFQVREIDTSSGSLIATIGSRWTGYHQGSADGLFVNGPISVAVDSATGAVYVGEDGNGRISKFNSDRSFATKYGSGGYDDFTASFDGGLFTGPTGNIAFDASGNVFIVDRQNQRVEKFDSSGNFLLQWNQTTNSLSLLDTPVGVAVNRSTGNVYVLDRGNSKIFEYTNSGAYLSTIGQFGSTNGRFNNPNSIAIDGSGNIYVADTSNERVQKFDSAGAYAASWSNPGSWMINLAVTDSGDTIYVMDDNNGIVQKAISTNPGNTSYTLDSEIGSMGGGDGQYSYPGEIGVDSDGRVFIADTDFYKISVFSNTGAFIQDFGYVGADQQQIQSPQAMGIDPNGNIYVGDNNNRIQVFNTFVAPPEPATPDAVTNLQSIPGDEHVYLTWTAPVSNPVVTDYLIEYSSNGGRTFSTFNDGVSSTASTDVTGLTNGTEYTFRVTARNALGDGVSANTTGTPAAASCTFTSIVAAGYHSIGIKSDGTVWTWGADQRVPNGDSYFITNTKAPTQVTGLSNIIQVAAGDFNSDRPSYALKSDGTVWKWKGTTGAVTQFSGLSGITYLTHGAAIGANGTVWTWTANGTTETTPTELAGFTGGVKIATDYDMYALTAPHYLIIKNDGTLWSFGWNVHGQLGIGSSENTIYTDPVQVVNDEGGFLTNVTDIAAGYHSSYAVQGNGNLWAWGYNFYGEVGGVNPNPGIPAFINTGVTAIAAGDYFATALKSDGTVWSWGEDSYNQLGDGNGSYGYSTSTPVQATGISTATAVASGYGHALALLGDGTVWSWGLNNNGEAGDATFNERTLPGPISTFCSVTPNSGSVLGGETVTITGSNFRSSEGGPTVMFGSNAATNVSVSSTSSMTATVPAHAAGLVSVSFQNFMSDAVSKAGAYNYTSPLSNPTVTNVFPSGGPSVGGRSTLITGTGFQDGATVRFGGTLTPQIDVTFIDSTQISVIAPAHAAGSATVSVTNPDSGAGELVPGYNYVDYPVITSITPSIGPVEGGTNVTINGTDFQDGSALTIGGQSFTNLIWVSSTEFTATTPAHAAGAVDVVISDSPNGGNATLTNGYTYGNPTMPDPVVINYANPGNGDVTLHWTNGSDGGSPITSYIIIYGLNSDGCQPATSATGCSSFTITSSDAEFTTHTKVFSSLTNDSQYNFAMYPINAIESAPISNQVSATPSVSAGECTAPGGVGRACGQVSIACDSANGSLSIQAPAAIKFASGHTVDFAMGSASDPSLDASAQAMSNINDDIARIRIIDTRGYDPANSSCGTGFTLSVQSAGLKQTMADGTAYNLQVGLGGINDNMLVEDQSIVVSSPDQLVGNVVHASTASADNLITTSEDIVSSDEAFTGSIDFWLDNSVIPYGVLKTRHDAVQVLSTNPLDTPVPHTSAIPVGSYTGVITLTLSY